MLRQQVLVVCKQVHKEREPAACNRHIRASLNNINSREASTWLQHKRAATGGACDAACTAWAQRLYQSGQVPLRPTWVLPADEPHLTLVGCGSRVAKLQEQKAAVHISTVAATPSALTASSIVPYQQCRWHPDRCCADLSPIQMLCDFEHFDNTGTTVHCSTQAPRS